MQRPSLRVDDAGMSFRSSSDKAMAEDYQKVLGPGAELAGPLAEQLRAGVLPEESVEWLKTNFFKEISASGFRFEKASIGSVRAIPVQPGSDKRKGRRRVNKKRPRQKH